jgi:alanine racemase
MSSLAAVRVDLARIRANTQAIARQTGAPIVAVVKADAYGLGAQRVARAIKDLVSGFYTFSLREAVDAALYSSTGRPTIALEPLPLDDAKPYVEHRVRPAVWSTETASQLRAAHPVLSVDTGQHRFGAAPEDCDAILHAGDIREAFTHATRIEQVEKIRTAVGGRGLTLHAAATALLDLGDGRCWLDATRPGLALYRGAARVSARLVESHDSNQPSGYTGFVTPRHGVIVVGYADGLRRGLCLISGQRRRVLEVGMQSAFVELGPNDKAGDEVVLLGDGLSEQEVATAWGCTPHEALFRLARSAPKTYVE